MSRKYGTGRIWDVNRERVSDRRLPKRLEPLINDPAAWRLYGHYNEMTWQELQDEIKFRKDGMTYQDEFEFMCELYMKKKSGATIVIPTGV